MRVANTPRELTLATAAADRRLAEGDWLMVKYTKSGTDAFKNLSVNVDLVQGVR